MWVVISAKEIMIYMYVYILLPLVSRPALLIIVTHNILIVRVRVLGQIPLDYIFSFIAIKPGVFINSKLRF